jgi:HlyD family secretion protein
VTFTVDAYPGQPFPGTVAQVRNAPITVQNVVTYDVVVAVDNPRLELKPGMTANVLITTAHRDGALRVPVRALRFRPEQKRTPGAENRPQSSPSAVFIVKPDNTLRRVEVKTGIRDNQYVEVLDGSLTEGDRVATGLRRETPETTTQSRPPGFGGLRRF